MTELIFPKAVMGIWMEMKQPLSQNQSVSGLSWAALRWAGLGGIEPAALALPF